MQWTIKILGSTVFWGIITLEVFRIYRKPSISYDVINFDAYSETFRPGPTQCPGVLSHMTQGRWITRPLSKLEDEEISNFFTHVHKQLDIPPDYQRPDGRCGNVPYIGMPTSSYFRAMCDPKGETPCCYQSRCQSRSISACVCKGCFDLRVQRHAEYSTWSPSDNRCAVPEVSQQELCRILRGSTLRFFGDSLVRHLYTAMLLVVTGDVKYGALIPGTPTEVRRQCEGLLMFTEKLCRLHLNRQTTACGGTVRLTFSEAFRTALAKVFQREVLQEVIPKSLAVFGIGIHDSFNTADVIDAYIEPLVHALHYKQSQWPKLLWASPHTPGILKSPSLFNQSPEQVKLYNAKMERYLWYRSIPVFNSVNMTQGMMSFDGQHYGRGINLMKAKIIINYIRELQDRGLWS